MKYWTEYTGHDVKKQGKRNPFDNNIYTLDIETTSYILLNNKIYKAIDYKDMTKDDQESCEFYSFMYIWMLSINDIVYYGRTYKELKDFLTIIDNNIPIKKYLFIHNLSFEFQFLKGFFKFKNVLSRKSRKVMTCEFTDFNFECRCTLYMSNVRLELLPKLFNLDTKKMVGDLDYNLIRTVDTKLTRKELRYCENDCVVVYKYILRELETYGTVKDIPITSTGHVRRELKERIKHDYNYRRKVMRACNTDPHIYNLLQECFMGGYTHASVMYADEILEDIDSFDYISSYPYVLTTHRYPATQFKKCRIEKREQMISSYAYIIVVRFKNIKSNYYNNFISESKCRNTSNMRIDNGRVIQADSLEITLTDVDFRLILDTYSCEYEILEAWYSKYDYLPITFINFVLDKYVNKTKFKGVAGKELEYQKEKNKFNALYGMSVTNTIRDNVIFDNITGWDEVELTNDEIIDKLLQERKKGFLSFAYGVWVTAYARNNLIRNIIALDEYLVYADTDSVKLLPGYDKSIIDKYNKFVERKIDHVAKTLHIDKSKFAPVDIKGKARMLGVFDFDGHYDRMITQGAKKYAVEKTGNIKDLLDDKGNIRKEYKIISQNGDSVKYLEITVAGVPKEGVQALDSLEDFKDDLVFRYEDTHKNMVFYCDDQPPREIIDYQGHKTLVNDLSGCSIVPTTYVLGKSLEYAELISDDSSKRAIYKE